MRFRYLALTRNKPRPRPLARVTISADVLTCYDNPKAGYQAEHRKDMLKTMIELTGELPPSPPPVVADGEDIA